MKYQKFIIKNFKGIDNIDIDLTDNRILTLVGLNESGKTSVMEGINLFYQMIKGNEPEEDKLNTYRPKGTDFTGDIVIESNLILEENDIIKIKKYWKEELNKKTKLEIPTIFNYIFKFNFKLHKFQKENTTRNCTFQVKTSNAKSYLSKIDNESWQKLVVFIKKLIPEILYYDDFIFEIPDSIYFSKSNTPENNKINSSNNKIWQSVIDDILKACNNEFNFKEHIVDIWETDNDSASNRISQMEQILHSKITTRWSDLFGDQKVNFKEIEINKKYSNNILELSFTIKTESGKIFSVNERSKGFKWFFSFLLFTEFRKNRTKNILFLLDEPAPNLHSSAQNKIIDAINDLSKESLVIYSTHSHHLINPKWLSGTYICINESLSENEFSGNLNLNETAKINAMKYFTYIGKGFGDDKISYFQPILDKLDYKPSFIEPIPNIVILEGKNDWYTLKYFSEIIFNSKKEIKFYPGAGCNKLWDIIRLYLSWGNHFLVILDGDNGGIQAQEEYNSTFNEFTKDKIFTFKDILSLNTDMEGLFKNEDKEKIIDSVLGNNVYNQIKNKKSSLKSNLYIAITKLLIDKKKINLSNETKNNFKNLFQFINNKLK